METGGQPGRQTGLRRRQVDTGHANLGKSQLTAPDTDLRDELNSIDHHTTIVGSESETAALAARLATSPALDHAVLALHGDLGAGKTTLVRHLLRALGINGRIKSPTYAVVEPHEVARPASWPPGTPLLAISHFDFYRFNDPREWEDAGFRELFAAPGLKLVEWPEKAEGMMPTPDADITLETMDDDTRRLSLHARSARGQALIEALAT